ncbi:MAG: hypothetical protein WCI18_02820 [Pseudomonadota bacterium]|jgi:hypothetical protein
MPRWEISNIRSVLEHIEPTESDHQLADIARILYASLCQTASHKRDLSHSTQPGLQQLL